MDVVNGKIVASRSERSDMWSALKPSRARAVDGSRVGGHEKPDQLPSWGNDWAPSWAASPRFRGSMSPPSTWGASTTRGHDAPSLALEPGAARWIRSSPDMLGSTPHKAALSASHDVSVLAPQDVATDRKGWNRSGPGLKCKGGDGDRLRHHCSFRPCSDTVLDAEMTMYESQISRAVSGKFSIASRTSSASQEAGSPVETEAASAASADAASADIESEKILRRSGSIGSKDAAGTQSKLESALAATSCDLKRKRLEDFENEQDVCGWMPPLKFLIRKQLSVSDVGDLGRIVLPKKVAENQFPQIDTKDGKMLEMADYTASRRWCFRYKWWINNKSRMYVLENTGEFIRYHSLKEYDSFVVYEDGCRKLVVRGQKKITSDSIVDQLNAGSKVEGSAVEPSPSPEDKSSGGVALTIVAKEIWYSYGSNVLSEFCICPRIM